MPAPAADAGRPRIDAEFVRRVAGLARLEVSEQALPALTAQFGRILDLVSAVGGIAVPEAASAGLAAVGPEALRADVPGETLTREEIRAIAPAHDGAFLVVPRVLAAKGGDGPALEGE